MRESQKSIEAWRAETFGTGSIIRLACRANEEMAELLRAITAGAPPDEVAAECADVLIVLYGVAERLGFDLHEQVNRKMAVNRTREWTLDDAGHGHHKRVKG